MACVDGSCGMGSASAALAWHSKAAQWLIGGGVIAWPLLALPTPLLRGVSTFSIMKLLIVLFVVSESVVCVLVVRYSPLLNSFAPC